MIQTAHGIDLDARHHGLIHYFFNIVLKCDLGGLMMPIDLMMPREACLTYNFDVQIVENAIFNSLICPMDMPILALILPLI
jgi:hypothetical protein